MIEGFDGLGVVGDAEFFLGDAGVGAVEEVAGEDLRGFHRPEALALEGAQTGITAVFFDRVGDAVSEYHGVFADDDFMEGNELFGAYEWAGTIVDEDVGDVRRERGEGSGDGVLALGAAFDEDARRGRVRREREHLALIAVNDDVEIGDATGGKGGGGMSEDGPTGQGGEDFIGDGTSHARAAAGGEEDGGGTWHGRFSWVEDSCLGAGELGQDGAGGGNGIRGFKNRSADDDVAGARAGGFGGRHDTRLVAGIGATRTNAGRDEGNIGGERGSQRGELKRRANEAAKTGIDGESAETYNLICGGGTDAGFSQAGGIHRSEDGHAE